MSKNQAGTLQGVFYKYIYNPFFEKRSFVSDLILKGVFHNDVTHKGEIIDTERGSRIDAVFISVNTIAREVASTPIDIIKNTSKGKEKQRNGIYRLLAIRPNRNMSAINFWYTVLWNYLTYGNSYNLIRRDGNLTPIEILPLHPRDVKVQRTGGDVFYVVKDQVIPSRDILHFKQYTIDGIQGISPIEYNQSVLTHKVNQQDFSNNSIGKKPTGFISGELSEEQLNQLGKNWTGRVAKGEMPVINGADAKFNALTISPNEAQFLETSKYTDQKVYAIYNLPPTFAQDYGDGVKANAEQQALTLIKHTLITHYMIIEQECDEKLFPESNKSKENPLFVKFNQWGKLRGDTSATNEQIRTNVTLGIWNADDVRDKIYDMEKQPDGLGETFFIQGAMVDKSKPNLLVNSNGQLKNAET